MPTTAHTNLYDAKSYEAILEHIHAIHADTPAQWGKMNAAQMFAHCTAVLEVTNGQKSLNIPFFIRLFTPMIRTTVFGAKPYPKNGQTSPEFIQESPKDFAEEKARLLQAIETFYTMDKAQASAIKHPLFGKTALEQRGWAMLKHLDHHLQQFGQPSLAFA